MTTPSSDQNAGAPPAWITLLGMPAWITGSDGNIHWINERAQELLGRSPDEVIGQPCHGIVCGTTPKGDPLCGPRCSIPRKVELGHEIEPVAMRIPGRDGKDSFVKVVVIAAEGVVDGEYQLVHCVVDENKEERLRRYIDKVVHRTPHAGREPKRLDDFKLTDREKQILSMLARDETLHGIAETLCVSYVTVRNHVQHILSKLGVHSILEAVAVYLLCEDE